MNLRRGFCLAILATQIGGAPASAGMISGTINTGHNLVIKAGAIEHIQPKKLPEHNNLHESLHNETYHNPTVPARDYDLNEYLHRLRNSQPPFIGDTSDTAHPQHIIQLRNPPVDINQSTHGLPFQRDPTLLFSIWASHPELVHSVPVPQLQFPFPKGAPGPDNIVHDTVSPEIPEISGPHGT